MSHETLLEPLYRERERWGKQCRNGDSTHGEQMPKNCYYVALYLAPAVA